MSRQVGTAESGTWEDEFFDKPRDGGINGPQSPHVDDWVTRSDHRSPSWFCEDSWVVLDSESWVKHALPLGFWLRVLDCQKGSGSDRK